MALSWLPDRPASCPSRCSQPPLMHYGECVMRRAPRRSSSSSSHGSGRGLIVWRSPGLESAEARRRPDVSCAFHCKLCVFTVPRPGRKRHGVPCLRHATSWLGTDGPIDGMHGMRYVGVRIAIERERGVHCASRSRPDFPITSSHPATTRIGASPFFFFLRAPAWFDSAVHRHARQREFGELVDCFGMVTGYRNGCLAGRSNPIFYFFFFSCNVSFLSAPPTSLSPSRALH